MAEHPHAALVRRGYDAFSRGDMETLTELLAGDATQHLPGDSPMSGDYKGRDTILDLYRKLYEETDGTLRVEMQGAYVDGRGHVLTVHRMTAQRKGRTFEGTGGFVIRVVGGKVVDLDECVESIERLDEFWA
ncbi:nuclear transport factor 2 family protein [Streptomyces sp. JJ36]|uniref:nuclear transport factor 2 family protein n=1 Tax=Streptomyces sp. JJ36 TaxID=2736645 RepID=UPI001F43A7E1|nr:nuclear transport factor 2 family protein [Streptomyces sp. JJ36]MCF6523136.1 nuclear transport factor 2 family protein [Streptomyces sp. JJ36]